MSAMWQAQRTTIRENWGETIAVPTDGQPLSVENVVAGWHDDEAFRDFFIRELAATAYPAFFWEMPPLTRASLSTTFECAVIRSDALAQMQADDSAFAANLNATSASVESFRNLGGDALLVAPRRISDLDCYAHVGAFARAAPRAQQHALFQLLANEIEAMLQSDCRFWVSTSGLGVPWVHIRLDSRPKYYQYRRYAEK